MGRRRHMETTAQQPLPLARPGAGGRGGPRRVSWGVCNEVGSMIRPLVGWFAYRIDVREIGGNEVFVGGAEGGNNMSVNVGRGFGWYRGLQGSRRRVIELALFFNPFGI